jgi:hypothetical protein
MCSLVHFPHVAYNINKIKMANKHVYGVFSIGLYFSERILFKPSNNCPIKSSITDLTRLAYGV